MRTKKFETRFEYYEKNPMIMIILNDNFENYFFDNFENYVIELKKYFKNKRFLQTAARKVA